MTPQIPQSIEEVRNEEIGKVFSLVEQTFSDPHASALSWDAARKLLARTFSDVLTLAIQGERNRIIKLLPPKKTMRAANQTGSDAGFGWTKGYNDYRREVLEIITPKE